MLARSLGAHGRRAVRACLILSITLCLVEGSFISSASAQWEVRSYVGISNSVYFMDDVGAPHIGFAGTPTGLMRSTDTGHTWAPVPNTGRIYFRDFSFKDALVGWGAATSGTYKTTNGGLTWELEFTAMSTAVKYVRSTGYVFVSVWSGLCQQSRDEGATWSAFAPSSGNGYAALDDSTVYMTTLAGPGRYTTNGGETWTTSPMQTEVWQPTALTTSRMFLAVSEQTNQVLRSTDLGNFWMPGQTLLNPTGCVRGNDNYLVATTREAMVLSTDQGMQWRDICGPRASVDSRFWVRGTEIFAISYNGFLYYNPTGTVAASKQIMLAHSPNEITSDGCEASNGSIQIAIAACSAKIINIAVTGDPAFMVLAPTVPLDMRSGYTINFSYHPATAGPHSSKIQLQIEIDGKVIDTSLTITGRRMAKMNAQISPAEVKLAVDADCEGNFIPVTLLNKACNAYTIDSFQLSDPVHFAVSGLNVGDVVNSLDELSFNVRAQNVTDLQSVGLLNVFVSTGSESVMLSTELELRSSSVIKPPFPDKQTLFINTCESKQNTADIINLFCNSITIDSVHFSNTTDFQPVAMTYPVTLARYDTLRIPYMALPPRPGPASTRVTMYYRLLDFPSQLISTHTIYGQFDLGLPSDTLKVVTNGQCPKFDTSFALENSLCDMMKITRITPALQPQLQFTLPSLPVVLQPGASIEIPMSANAAVKGSLSSKLAIQYEIYGKLFDTILYVSIKIPKTFKIESTVASQNFGKTSICAPKRKTVYLINDLCVDVTYDRIALSSASNAGFSLFRVPQLPLVLKQGDQDSIVVEFAPTVTGNATGSVEVKMHSSTTSLDTFFSITGVGSGSVNAAIRDAKLAFGTSTTCEKLRSSTVVSNDGCEPMDVVAVTIANGFRLLSPALPYPLAPGASVELVFETTSGAIGPINAVAQVRLLSKQNLEQILTCELSAEIAKETPHLLAASMDVGEHSECAPIDSSIVVMNPSECEDLTVQAAFTSTDATLTGSTSSVIPAGGSATFTYRIAPNANTSVALRLFGDGLDTTVSINYAFVAGGGSLVLNAPSSTFETNACDVLLKPVTISNTTCSALEVSNISLSPYTRFAIDGSWTYPILIPANESFIFNVRFDPKAIGANTASLEVTDRKGATLNSVLTGNFAPPQVLSAGITSAGMQEVIAGDELEIDLTMTQDVASPIAIDELIAQFAFDTDLLTLVRVEPGTDWTVTSNQPISGGAALGLSHTASTYSSGDRIATLVFRSTLAKDNSGTVRLQDLKINPADPDFAECVANLAFTPSGSNVTVKYFCGGETLRSALAGELPVKNIRVRPHPASSKDKSLHVSFESALEGAFELELVNVLGVVSGQSTVQSQTGLNEVTMPLSGASSGWHLLRIRGALGTAGIRVLLVD